MPQIYSRAAEEVVTGGTVTCIPLPAPTRGILRRLIVKQKSGTSSGFTVNLYDRSDACADTPEISDGLDNQDLQDPELHRICLPAVVAPASVLTERHQMQCAYENADEQDVRRTQTSRIYLELDVAGSGDKLFQFAWSVEPITSM